MSPTKIVATVGPASQSEEVLRRFIETGIDVVRLNMSHAGHDECGQIVDTLRRLTDQQDQHIAIMADLAGPKVRTGPIDPHRAEIRDNDTCLIVRRPIDGTAARFGTNHAGLVEDVEVDHRILIDDGQICLRVVEKSGDGLICRCDDGGTIGSRKGVNVPDSDLTLPALTEKDHQDLAWATENQVDFVALSFVRRVEDIQLLRRALDNANTDMPILAKIETPQAIQVIDGIIEASDGIMVARGDLGVEMDVTRVPLLQKDIVRRCRAAGKPVIIATQMLHSMIHEATPTRAEVSDVANAVLDGTDAVMLSGESAAGRYPVRAVAMMNRICEQVGEFRPDETERTSDPADSHLRVGHKIDRMASAVARSTAIVAQDLGARLIAAWCRTGRTARWLSKYRVDQPLIALSSDPAVCRRLALSYGVRPMLVPDDRPDAHRLWSDIEGRLAAQHNLAPGDFIVIIGDPTDPARSCTISIRTVEG